MVKKLFFTITIRSRYCFTCFIKFNAKQSCQISPQAVNFNDSIHFFENKYQEMIENTRGQNQCKYAKDVEKIFVFAVI